VVEHLPSKALSSNPSTAGKKKKKEKIPVVLLIQKCPRQCHVVDSLLGDCSKTDGASDWPLSKSASFTSSTVCHF
jgi:hypothetical protein